MVYGGPDGEIGASLRYLSQRYSMPYPELKAILTDIGTEESVPHHDQLHLKSAIRCFGTIKNVDAYHRVLVYSIYAFYSPNRYSRLYRLALSNDILFRFNGFQEISEKSEVLCGLN